MKHKGLTKDLLWPLCSITAINEMLPYFYPIKDLGNIPILLFKDQICATNSEKTLL